MSTSPEPPAFFTRKWTGPERRVKKYLRDQGSQVVRAGRPFWPWHLLAIHPTEGVRLLWVHPPRGPDPDLSALLTFACDPAWAKEVWRFPATARGPWIQRLDGHQPSAKPVQAAQVERADERGEAT